MRWPGSDTAIVSRSSKNTLTSYRIHGQMQLGRDEGPGIALMSICLEEQMAILGWILFGLVIGALAKLVMPGRDPGGIIVTMLLGIAGAVLGGFIGRAMGWYGEGEAAGWVVSFLGAVALLALYRMFTRRRTMTP
jgi:uncharacterized membrane protein YeaQ/YmgE (transglycosylase-associated protein family)